MFCEFLGIKTKEELRDVNAAHVTAFRNFMLEEKKTPATINTRLSALSSLFNELVSKQIISYNPVTGVKRPKEEYDKVKSIALSKEHAKHMMDRPDTNTLKGVRDKAILSILFYTGCRIGEVCKLKVKDNFQEKGHFVLDFSIKGGRRNRVPITPMLQEAIDNYLNLMSHTEDRDSAMFLPLKKGKADTLIRHLDQTAVLNIWNAYEVVEQSTPHSARTTFISTAYEHGVLSTDIQRTVGHRDSRTTDKYDHSAKSYSASATYKVWY
ncbi:integrase [Candidatus Marinamargulisbacteria bacterium SCGC AAA071-K20]|nr:integrase [Candidatus Marinamargulisbacteria bacterium SCGC AAA071-K20]